jgi:hypothetical protein
VEPKRTIEEWVALFELEPNFQHVFVEGENDQRAIESLFYSLGRNSVAVRIAQDVELPTEYLGLPRSPFSSGNKARLRIFAQEIDRLATGAITNVRCVIDKDCDAILPFVPDSSLICMTDFANLPISFIEYEPIRYVINAVFGHRLELDDFRFIMETATFVTAFRICRYAFAPEVHGVSIEKSISSRADGPLEFDRRDYVTRLANSQGLGAHSGELFENTTSLIMRFQDDPRNYINYHDFISIFSSVLRQRRFIPGGVSTAELERMIRATINRDRMLRVSLLRELADWAR